MMTIKPTIGYLIAYIYIHTKLKVSTIGHIIIYTHLHMSWTIVDKVEKQHHPGSLQPFGLFFISPPAILPRLYLGCWQQPCFQSVSLCFIVFVPDFMTFPLFLVGKTIGDFPWCFHGFFCEYS